MLIENYKGIEINHDAKKDRFYTNVIILKGANGKKDQYIEGHGLQKTRDEIDKFLNTSKHKPVLKKVWIRRDEDFELVEIILHNPISKTYEVRRKDGKTETIKPARYERDKTLYLQCKENDAIVKNIMEKQKQIDKIKKEYNCSSGKLIPLTEEHFE